MWHGNLAARNWTEWTPKTTAFCRCSWTGQLGSRKLDKVDQKGVIWKAILASTSLTNSFQVSSSGTNDHKILDRNIFLSWLKPHNWSFSKANCLEESLEDRKEKAALIHTSV